ncbi:bifunctional folylpolyglutamate synthase/dihydrofolate synthase [Alkaliphilus serpentinus]|uniref:Dihydrofolate synthase/folylpolyglutamate synthase n=1 Tax=Alkaliphilus serpentinus TaxID=1482731 RepID=A0A833HNT3_9FIRM|nr:folylpolyglutamate synthase/dihydrofolate synthase family protein [Alkaliphilus serpentinus]KAB3529873.1 bifunctional folylpolyglutamate synthase/dihydrofolate synthase [Alkaliphilus serpentinus]
MNYQQALEHIHGTYKFGSKLGIENIKYLLSMLGDPHKKLKVIHIAGTNGKGSTASFLHQILMEEGYRVGLYTSPYLESFTERIKINGENIAEEKLARITEIVKEKIEEMVQEGRNHPTEFEVVTAIAFYYYAEEAIDLLVLEVGLGGRLDATNVVENPLLSIITPIGFDHMEYLGDTLEKIAFEKAGIIKENCPTVVYPQEPGVIEVFKEVCKERKSSLEVANFEDIILHRASIEEQSFTTTILGEEYKDLKIKLIGQHQIYNSITALTAIEVLKRRADIKVSKTAIYKGLENTRWPGRLEIVGQSPLIIIDGAHNIHGAVALKNSIELYLKDYSVTLVLGMLQDKDVEGFTSLVVPLVDRVIATKPDNPRAMDANNLAEKLTAFGKELFAENDIAKAVDLAIGNTPAGGVVLVAGSLYMIGEARRYIRSMNN